MMRWAYISFLATVLGTTLAQAQNTFIKVEADASGVGGRSGSGFFSFQVVAMQPLPPWWWPSWKLAGMWVGVSVCLFSFILILVSLARRVAPDGNRWGIRGFASLVRIFTLCVCAGGVMVLSFAFFSRSFPTGVMRGPPSLELEGNEKLKANPDKLLVGQVINLPRPGPERQNGSLVFPTSVNVWPRVSVLDLVRNPRATGTKIATYGTVRSVLRWQTGVASIYVLEGDEGGTIEVQTNNQTPPIPNTRYETLGGIVQFKIGDDGVPVPYLMEFR